MSGWSRLYSIFGMFHQVQNVLKHNLFEFSRHNPVNFFADTVVILKTKVIAVPVVRKFIFSYKTTPCAVAVGLLWWFKT